MDAMNHSGGSGGDGHVAAGTASDFNNEADDEEEGFNRVVRKGGSNMTRVEPKRLKGGPHNDEMLSKDSGSMSGKRKLGGSRGGKAQVKNSNGRNSTS